MVLGKQENNLCQKATCTIEPHGKLETKDFRTQKNNCNGVF